MGSQGPGLEFHLLLLFPTLDIILERNNDSYLIILGAIILFGLCEIPLRGWELC